MNIIEEPPVLMEKDYIIEFFDSIQIELKKREEKSTKKSRDYTDGKQIVSAKDRETASVLLLLSYSQNWKNLIYDIFKRARKRKELVTLNFAILSLSKKVHLNIVHHE